ncbi:hypothetical protein X946_5536 [Burkholderia sp. ABCPW 111]|nr:hypothetical protein X946_5536 [Burkholderia sp. ABCPW 111]
MDCIGPLDRCLCSVVVGCVGAERTVLLFSILIAATCDPSSFALGRFSITDIQSCLNARPIRLAARRELIARCLGVDRRGHIFPYGIGTEILWWTSSNVNNLNLRKISKLRFYCGLP